MFASFAKKNAYLRKIAEEIGIEVDLQRIMGQDLCKIKNIFYGFLTKKNFNCTNCLIHDKLVYH